MTIACETTPLIHRERRNLKQKRNWKKRDWKNEKRNWKRTGLETKIGKLTGLEENGIGKKTGLEKGGIAKKTGLEKNGIGKNGIGEMLN